MPASRRSAETIVVPVSIRLPMDASSSEATHITCQIEDISRADAPKAVVAETRLERITLIPGGTISCKLRVPKFELSGATHLSVWVHVDVDGSGNIDRGDLISTQSYPVVPDASPAVIEVAVHKVK